MVLLARHTLSSRAVFVLLVGAEVGEHNSFVLDVVDGFVVYRGPGLLVSRHYVQLLVIRIYVHLEVVVSAWQGDTS